MSGLTGEDLRAADGRSPAGRSGISSIASMANPTRAKALTYVLSGRWKDRVGRSAPSGRIGTSIGLR